MTQSIRSTILPPPVIKSEITRTGAVGPPGPSEVTDQTATNLVGLLSGDGEKVGALPAPAARAFLEVLSQSETQSAITAALAAYTPTSSLAAIATSGSASDLIIGTLANARLSPQVVRSDFSYPDPSWVTSIAASKLIGIIDDARLSSSVPFKNGNSVFTGGNTFQSTQVFEASICVGVGGLGPRIRQGSGQTFRLNTNNDSARASLEVGNINSTGTGIFSGTLDVSGLLRPAGDVELASGSFIQRPDFNILLGWDVGGDYVAAGSNAGAARVLNIGANHTQMIFRTSGTVRGGFLGNGNFQIGNNSDNGSLLQVFGTANINGATSIGSTLGVSGVTTLTGGLTYPINTWINDSTPAARIQFIGSGATVIRGHGANIVDFASTGGSAIGRFTTTGFFSFGNISASGSYFLTAGTGPQMYETTGRFTLRNNANNDFAGFIANEGIITSSLGGSVATPSVAGIHLKSALNAYSIGGLFGKSYSANLAYGDVFLWANPLGSVVDYSNRTEDLAIRGNTGNIEVNRGNLIVGNGTAYGKLNVYGGPAYIIQDQPIVWHSAGTIRSQIIGDSTDNLRISTRFGGVLGERLTVLSGGNVGIGQTNPAARLEVASVNAGSSTRLGFRIDSIRGTSDTEPHMKFIRTAVAGWNLAQPSSSLTLYLDTNAANPEFTFAQGAIFVADGQIKIGNTSGVRLKNSSGTLQARNDGDTAFASAIVGAFDVTGLLTASFGLSIPGSTLGIAWNGSTTDRMTLNTGPGGVFVLRLGNVDVISIDRDSQVSNALRIQAGNTSFAGHVTSRFQSLSVDPTTLDIPSGLERLVKNTTSGEIRRFLNDGGTIKKSPAYI